MDRKKRPILTAPWKIGFLVILMVIVTGLGVTRLITGTFGLTWTWIDLAGVSPSEWTFSLPAFIHEMVPVLAIIALLALVSYVLVVGAVSRYHKSVVTDTEHKQLLRSIKSLEDLEDEALQESLAQHPELREFLLGLKNRMAARERQQQHQNERGKRPPRETNEAPPANLASETGLLVQAIAGGIEALQNEIALTIPELKQIERIVRERLTQAARKVAEPSPASREAEASLRQIRDHLVAVRRDADACVNGAREMDRLLASLKKAAAANEDSAVATDGIKRAARQMDIISDTILTLGEDTRRVAIVAALQASGNGGEGDAIQVAEDVRTIATRFNGVAQTWKETGPVLRSAIDTIAKGSGSAGERRAVLVSAAETASGKASLWSERLVAMLEQMRELERAAGVESAAPAPAIEEDSEPDYGAIDASLTETEDVAPAAPVVEEPEPAPAESEGEEDPDIIQGRTRPVFETEEAEDEAQFADIPGFQKERDVIIEPSSSDGGAHDDASGDADPEVAIEVDRDEDDWRVKSAADEIQAAPRGASDSSPDDNDGFIIGPRGKKKAEKAPASEPEKGERKAAPKKSRVAPIPVEEVSGIVDDASEAVEPVDVIEEDSDPDAVDLYEYGAVDYVAGVHA